MIDIDLEIPAQILVLPAAPRAGEVSHVRRGISLKRAIRFVVEALPEPERRRALIRTSARTLYAAEIEALYAHPDFPHPKDAHAAFRNDEHRFDGLAGLNAGVFRQAPAEHHRPT